MSDKTMKIILSVLTVILLALIVGLVAMKGSSVKADLNKLALRIGELRQYRTMGRADVNAADNLQHTALYYAGERGFTEIVELLLAAGAEG